MGRFLRVFLVTGIPFGLLGLPVDQVIVKQDRNSVAAVGA